MIFTFCYADFYAILILDYQSLRRPMMARNIEICDGFENMDFERVTRMLSQAKWSIGIGIDEVKQGALYSALVVGAFHGTLQVGYARVVSDRTRFAYIADVYVDDEFRHNGIAKQMVTYILSHDSLKDVYQWVLKSAADELYKAAGFVPFSEPEKWMEIRNKRPER
jgi:GNAT superfamily N-acetyltransferase